MFLKKIILFKEIQKQKPGDVSSPNCYRTGDMRTANSTSPKIQKQEKEVVKCEQCDNESIHSAEKNKHQKISIVLKVL